jgi:hypothetical protein
MNRCIRSLSLVALLFGLHGLVAGPALADLEVGDAAPAFSLAGSDGQTYTLESLLEKHQGVVLAWFPKAFTPG